MFSEQFLVVQRVRCRERGVSKKRALQTIGELLADEVTGLTGDQVFDKLLERERLGSTGLGHGIGLPHARVEGLEQAMGAFLQLERGVDYDAPDSQPVDLLFGLLVPGAATQEHLELLAGLARMFSDRQFCARLRGAASAQQLFDLLVERQSEIG